MKRGIFRSGLGVLVALVLSIGFASADQAPDCDGQNGQPISVNNGQVLQWETTTPNQYLNRANVSGTITDVYPDHSGHSHFAIQIGPNSSDRVEIVYNQDFGTVPTPTVGDQVHACGDYITSTEQAGPYPASPCNAIVHWVHQSDNTAKHADGFLMINGQVYGYLHGGPSSGPQGGQNNQGGDNQGSNNQGYQNDDSQSHQCGHHHHHHAC